MGTGLTTYDARQWAPPLRNARRPGAHLSRIRLTRSAVPTRPPPLPPPPSPLPPPTQWPGKTFDNGRVPPRPAQSDENARALYPYAHHAPRTHFAPEPEPPFPSVITNGTATSCCRPSPPPPPPVPTSTVIFTWVPPDRVHVTFRFFFFFSIFSNPTSRRLHIMYTCIPTYLRTTRWFCRQKAFSRNNLCVTFCTRKVRRVYDNDRPTNRQMRLVWAAPPRGNDLGVRTWRIHCCTFISAPFRSNKWKCGGEKCTACERTFFRLSLVLFAVRSAAV